MIALAIATALLGINLAAFLAFWWDKEAARAGGWRVREDTLLGLAVIGGSPVRNGCLRVLCRSMRWAASAPRLPAIVAEDGGRIAGWAAREKLDEEITDLWVDPVLQRRGIGTALLAAIEDEMRRSNVETADLQTHARNAPALAFFRNRGYSVNWLSVAYSPKLDRDVESVGLRRQLVENQPIGYGPGGF